jgi:RNA polymerase sigma-70 factor (ECF subfamily)
MLDSRIVELYWARSEQAIDETEKIYGRYFYDIAYGILRDDEDSKEIVNDTYIKAWNNIPPERPKNLKAFLGRITRQLSINRLEKNLAKKRGGGQYVLALEEIEECIPDRDNDVDTEELRNALNRFLRSLPDEPRRVFIRRYWHMSTISEIARDFSMSESKVKSMLMRTREKLKKYLLREGLSI